MTDPFATLIDTDDLDWIETPGGNALKVLWVSEETGAWSALKPIELAKILAISAEVVGGESGPMVQVKVRDHGTGIPTAMLEKVMNPFVTTKPAGVGTGLGLSICFELVKKHGGFLSVDSKHGEWTEVTATLPVCKR